MDGHTIMSHFVVRGRMDGVRLSTNLNPVSNLHYNGAESFVLHNVPWKIKKRNNMYYIIVVYATMITNRTQHFKNFPFPFDSIVTLEVPLEVRYVWTSDSVNYMNWQQFLLVKSLNIDELSNIFNLTQGRGNQQNKMRLKLL